jgi:hypothetical protein
VRPRMGMTRQNKDCKKLISKILIFDYPISGINVGGGFFVGYGWQIK